MRFPIVASVALAFADVIVVATTVDAETALDTTTFEALTDVDWIFVDEIPVAVRLPDVIALE